MVAGGGRQCGFGPFGISSACFFKHPQVKLCPIHRTTGMPWGSRGAVLSYSCCLAFYSLKSKAYRIYNSNIASFFWIFILSAHYNQFAFGEERKVRLKYFGFSLEVTFFNNKLDR